MRSTAGRLLIFLSFGVFAGWIQPTFRGGVDLVAVDFLALNKDGAAIRDLQAADITLRVDGRPREIRSLQFVELARARDEGVIVDAPPAPPYGSNRLTDAGRSIVVVIDRDSIHPGQEEPIRSALNHFIARLTATDRAGLVTLPRSPIEVGLTRDRNRFLEAVRKVSGQASQSLSETDKICRSRDMLFALDSVLQSLAPLDGPKTVVLIASALVAPVQDFASFIGRGSLAPLGTAPIERCDIKPDYFNAIGLSAAQSRVHLYVIQSEILRGEPGTKFSDSAGLESLAGVTGGEVLPLLAGEEAFKRVARESAGYYLLTFEPEAAERNGVSHKIDVRTARDNAALRARPTFVIPKPRERSARAHAKEMLRDDVPYRDLPMHVVAYTSRDAGSRLKIVAIAAPFDPAQPLVSAGMGLVDSKNRLTAQWTANTDELKARPLAAAMSVAPGNYRLRVAAVDAVGRSGAADYHVEARLIDAGPFKLSTMALGVVRDGQFAPMLQFRDEEAAVAYFEIYGSAKAGTLAATFDLLDANGISIGTLPLRVLQTSEEDRRIATALIPLAGLPAGDYVGQARVGTGVARATLRKVAGDRD